MIGPLHSWNPPTLKRGEGMGVSNFSHKKGGVGKIGGSFKNGEGSHLFSY